MLPTGRAKSKSGEGEYVARMRDKWHGREGKINCPLSGRGGGGRRRRRGEELHGDGQMGPRLLIWAWIVFKLHPSV